MTRILHRQIGHAYPVAAGGQGVFIRDAAGKYYIDASARPFTLPYLCFCDPKDHSDGPLEPESRRTRAAMAS
jgi:hypothetical protein